MRQVIVSDLHLSDGTIGSSVKEADLLSRLLEPISAAAPVRLVLLGDIFELLRSALWVDGVDPWKGVNSGFGNFPRKVQDTVGLIASGIESRYIEFSRQLRLLVEQKKVEPVFVPGNHDFMLQLAPAARQTVRRILSIPGSTEPFPNYYYDKPSALYAVHGHQYDALNWHDEVAGRWAFGDAIVLRLVNGFIRYASDALAQPSSNPDTPVSQAIQDLDNVDPITDLPLFFRYIMERHLSNSADHDEIVGAWSKSVDALLSVPHFQAKDGSEAWALRAILKASKHQSLAELATTVAHQLERVKTQDGGADIYSEELSKVMAAGKPARVFVYGHTHGPGIWPVGNTAEHPRYVINTGCWRRVVRRIPGTTAFVPREVHSLLWVEKDSDGQYSYSLAGAEQVR
jgi:UDP-2,3-diacylglucosamine pyrophosphatase LpxH